MEFIPSKPYTIGVELELQLLDSEHYNLTSAAPSILTGLPVEFKDRIKPEFIQSMVEVASGICDDLEELENDLKRSINLLEELARKNNCLIFSSSLHPFAPYRDQVLSPGKRYAALMEELQLSGRRLITQGLHIHIGLPDGATAIKVCNSIRQYLPLLLALTTSSPYYGGEDTGFFSYRSRLLDSLARAGLPHPFADWNDFRELLLLLKRSSIIEDIRDIWWDVRPHPDLGTIEIRICDLPVRFNEIIAIAGLVQSLVVTLAEKTAPHSHPPLELIATNKWQAARHGLDGKFVDQDSISEPLSMKEAIKRLLVRTEKAAKRLGSNDSRQEITRIMAEGSGAHRQRLLYENQADFREMIMQLQKDFWN
ncbi:MAG: YbdK family carboxylate-amine ligase [Thermodesulfobacteriota bacterium]